MKNQKTFLKFFILLAVFGPGFFAFSAEARAAEYYIAPATATPPGNDSNNGSIPPAVPTGVSVR